MQPTSSKYVIAIFMLASLNLASGANVPQSTSASQPQITIINQNGPSPGSHPDSFLEKMVDAIIGSGNMIHGPKATVNVSCYGAGNCPQEATHCPAEDHPDIEHIAGDSILDAVHSRAAEPAVIPEPVPKPTASEPAAVRVAEPASVVSAKAAEPAAAPSKPEAATVIPEPASVVPAKAAEPAVVPSKTDLVAASEPPAAKTAAIPEPASKAAAADIPKPAVAPAAHRIVEISGPTSSNTVMPPKAVSNPVDVLPRPAAGAAPVVTSEPAKDPKGPVKKPDSATNEIKPKETPKSADISPLAAELFKPVPATADSKRPFQAHGITAEKPISDPVSPKVPEIKPLPITGPENSSTAANNPQDPIKLDGLPITSSETKVTAPVSATAKEKAITATKPLADPANFTPETLKESNAITASVVEDPSASDPVYVAPEAQKKTPSTSNDTIVPVILSPKPTIESSAKRVSKVEKVKEDPSANNPVLVTSGTSVQDKSKDQEKKAEANSATDSSSHPGINNINSTTNAQEKPKEDKTGSDSKVSAPSGIIVPATAATDRATTATVTSTSPIELATNVDGVKKDSTSDVPISVVKSTSQVPTANTNGHSSDKASAMTPEEAAALTSTPPVIPSPLSKKLKNQIE